jgi:hypothetical protein
MHEWILLPLWARSKWPHFGMMVDFGPMMAMNDFPHENKPTLPIGIAHTTAKKHSHLLHCRVRIAGGDFVVDYHLLVDAEKGFSCCGGGGQQAEPTTDSKPLDSKPKTNLVSMSTLR